ncbi:MAG: hypothetical protein KF799_03200 [Bdellovibrionales bacterium]|nr:hypothetical protein [Bdellovibrionales bacterium]
MFSVVDRKTVTRTSVLYVGLTSLLLQQILVGFSTYLIVRITRNVEAEKPIIFLLFTFGMCILTPYFLAILNNLCLSRLKFALNRAFVRNFSTTFNARPFLWRSTDLKRTCSAILTKEGPGLIADSVDTGYYTLSLSLNLTIQSLALAYAIEGRLALVLLGGFLISIPLTMFNQKIVSRAAQAMENASYFLTKHISNLWDNVVLGNAYNEGRYIETYETRFAQARAKALTSILSTGTSSVVVALAFMLPLSMYVYSSLSSETQTKAGQLALMAVLPRLLMMLNAAYELLSSLNHVLSLGGRSAMLNTELEKSLRAADSNPPQSQFELLRLSDRDGGPIELPALPDILSKPGRTTITGPNGSGKSTFILKLKAQLGEQAFLLPCRHDLDFAQPNSELSTGQLQLQILTEIAERRKAKILLLDEWDANLDDKNRAALDTLIEVLSKQLRIIEVRHFQLNVVS